MGREPAWSPCNSKAITFGSRLLANHAHVDGDDRVPRSDVVAKSQTDFVRLESHARRTDPFGQNAFGDAGANKIFFKITVDASFVERRVPSRVVANPVVKA
jgi:hypothetical protein